MDTQRLQEIKARCEAATPGPWFWDTNRHIKHTALKAPQNGGTIVMDFARWGMNGAQPRFNDCGVAFGGILRTMDEYDKEIDTLPNPNAAFIANARQDIPDLLAEVERLNVLVIRYAAQLDVSYAAENAARAEVEWLKMANGELSKLGNSQHDVSLAIARDLAAAKAEVKRLTKDINWPTPADDARLEAALLDDTDARKDFPW